MKRSDIIKSEILAKARELGRQEREREKAWRDSPQGKAWRERWVRAVDLESSQRMACAGNKP